MFGLLSCHPRHTRWFDSLKMGVMAMPCQPFPAGGWWVPHHPAIDDDGEHGGGSGGNVGGKDGGKDDQLQGQWERHNTTNNFCPNQGSSCSPGTSPTQVNTMQCKSRVVAVVKH